MIAPGKVKKNNRSILKGTSNNYQINERLESSISIRKSNLGFIRAIRNQLQFGLAIRKLRTNYSSCQKLMGRSRLQIASPGRY